jgi:hypothetical protein
LGKAECGLTLRDEGETFTKEESWFFLYLLDQSRDLFHQNSDLWITRKLDPIKEFCSKESAEFGLLFFGKQNKAKAET